MTAESIVDVPAVLDATLRMASNQLRHRATVVRDYDGVPLIQANASQLGQVVLNLVLNAVNAMPEGRVADNQITVSARVLEEDEDWIEIAVADTGCGIPPERHPEQAERLIFISGGALSDDTRNFLDSVPNPTLSKPFEAALVRKAVLDASRKGRRPVTA